MKIFSLLETSYSEFTRRVNDYLSKTLTNYTTKNGSIFTQLINVLGSVTQNIFSYMEDSLTEQNKFTASRKRSIYNLASISGYNPSLGNATSLVVRLSVKPNNLQTQKLILPNHTKLTCNHNNLTYNVVLPQESIIIDLSKPENKYITLVEGIFETQQYICTGGQLYTQNIKFNKDCDIQYLKVYVNEELYEQKDSLYDMDTNSKTYTVQTSLKKGIDIIFGNYQYGRTLKEGDVIRVEYLLHNGEEGNLNNAGEFNFEFADTLQTTVGESVNANKIFMITVENPNMISSGVDSESIFQVRSMIGLNSRSLVLADAKNYKQFFNKFSFCGYNRTWSEPGSLIVTSLILKNISKLNKDYFDLTTDDFILSKEQKQSIINNINNSGQQLAGTSLNIIDPALVKYCMYIYVKMKNVIYDANEVEDNIKSIIGKFFTNIQNDFFIPKSDIILLIKNEIKDIDSVDIYMLSERNEKAIIDKEYINKTYTFNDSTNTYNTKTEKIYLYDGENPNLGFDAHGNILLTNPDEFPVLMGGWQFASGVDKTQMTTVLKPVTIIFN